MAIGNGRYPLARFLGASSAPNARHPAERLVALLLSRTGEHGSFVLCPQSSRARVAEAGERARAELGETREAVRSMSAAPSHA